MNQLELMGKVRRAGYNCAHYAGDVWEHETGQDIRHLLTGFLASRHNRHVSPGLRREFVRLEKPKSPCLVMFRRPSAKQAEPHCGVYVRGRVLHLDREMPFRQLLDDVVRQNGFTVVGFYDPC